MTVNILWLLRQVIDSFSTNNLTHIYAIADMSKKGLPLGNLISQLLVNIYINEFDQYMKHRLKTKYFIRYADDFVILNRDKNKLNNLLKYIAVFLREHLKLNPHLDKIFIKTLSSGAGFLG